MIVTYYFPPFNAVGAKRAFSVADYFSEHEWRVMVLKAPNKAYGTNIAANPATAGKGYKTIDVDVDLKIKNKILSNIRSYYKYKNKIAKIIQNASIDVILFSGGPFFYFPLGSYCKKKFGINYVLDYRDNELGRINRTFKNRVYGLFFNYFYDRPSVKNASYVINVTAWNTHKHVDKYRNLDKKKFITIYNGYDNSILNKLEDFISEYQVDRRYFNIGIFGKFAYYNQRHVSILLHAVKDLNKEGHRIRVYHIGKRECLFQKRAHELNLNDLVFFSGYIDYAEGMKALNLMSCFVLNNSMEGALGTKIFDYIFLNKPIIGMIKKPSELSNTLLSFKNGYVTENPFELKNILRTLIKNTPAFLDRTMDKRIYARSYQIEKLAERLNGLVSGYQY